MRAGVFGVAVLFGLGLLSVSTDAQTNDSTPLPLVLGKNFTLQTSRFSNYW